MTTKIPTFQHSKSPLARTPKAPTSAHHLPSLTRGQAHDGEFYVCDVIQNVLLCVVFFLSQHHASEILPCVGMCHVPWCEGTAFWCLFCYWWSLGLFSAQGDYKLHRNEHS